MTRRALLSRQALSGRALAWYAVIGVLAAVVTVPQVAGSGLWSWRWWAVGLAGQAACTVIVLALRRVARGPAAVLGVLAVAGAARGAAIAWSGEALGVITDPDWASRIGNSTIVTILWLGILGAVLASAREYEAQHRTLVERAVAIERANRDGASIDPIVLLSWSGVRERVDLAARRARERLEATGDPDSLTAAAAIIRAAIDDDLRPASHALWSSPVPEMPRLRGRSLLAQALAPWRPPLVPILAALGLVVGVGAFVRTGATTAIPYTLAYLVAVGAALGASAALARRTGADRAIALVTLALLPLLAYAAGDLVVRAPGLQRDVVAGAVVALQTPATVIVVTMLARLLSERRAVLDSLQQRIDAATVAQLAVEAQRRDDAAQLGTYVHHSVQSELAALAIQLGEAAATQDAVAIGEVRGRVLERLVRLVDTGTNDDAQPPWLRASTGRERIHEIAAAWQGIAEIALDLAGADGTRPDQWHLAAQVVEEGIANAVRHGGARWLRVSARVDDGALVVAIDDDGALREGAPGLGSAWLDTVAAGDWARTSSDGRTRLEATLR